MAVITSTKLITKSYELLPGEGFKLPNGAKLEGATNAGAIQSSCDGVINQLTYKCGYFSFAIDNDSATHPFDEASTSIKQFIVGDITYDVNVNAFISHPTNTVTENDISYIVSKLTDTLVFIVTSKTVVASGKRRIVKIYFKVIDKLFPKTTLVVSAINLDNNAYFYGLPIDCATQNAI